MELLDLIANDNFISVNKIIAKNIGLEESIMLGELASEYRYWKQNDKLEDDYFYSTIENIEENTTLNEYKQRKAINNLKQNNILDVKIKGMPAKRYIKINQEQVLKILNIQFFNNFETSSLNFKELDLENLKGNKNNIIKINNNKEIDISKLNKFNLSISKKDELEKEFEQLWELYPRKEGKKKAEDVYIKLRAKGQVTFEQVRDGINNYQKEIKSKNTQDRYIKQGATWFNQECWNDEYSSKREEEMWKRFLEDEEE